MLDTISVSVGDIFDTYSKGRTGYHEFGSSTVVITQGCGNDGDQRMESLRDSVQSNLIHELIHALFDVDAVYGDSHPMRSRWIQEGLTTILDETIRELNNEFISDDDRSVYSHEKETLYQLDRSFDQNLESLSPVIILLLRAFSGGEQEFAQLQHWIDEEWPCCSPDHLSFIGNSMREVDSARGLPEYY
jgi:hypothetical protein